jgi:putative hydrolase of the HAD superfamily
VWGSALKEYGINDSILTKRLIERFIAIRRQNHILFPETAEVLTNLQKEYALGMITNGDAQTQREKIQASNIEHFFDYVVVSGDIGKAKPDADIFHHALKQSNQIPEDSIMIGNSLEHDVTGAKAIGMGSVWVNRDAKEMQGAQAADFVVHDLRGLCKILPSSESA